MLNLDPDYRSLPAPILRGPRMAIIAAVASMALAPLLLFLYPWAPFEFGNPAIGMYVTATMMAQAMLAAFWSSFGPGENVNRRLRAAGWLLLIAVATALSPRSFRWLGEILCLSVGCFISLLMISGLLQLFFWPVTAWGWRLGVPAEEDYSKPMQWHVRHMLIGMAAVSVLLGIARVLLPQGIPINTDSILVIEYLAISPTMALLCLVAILRVNNFRLVAFPLIGSMLAIELFLQWTWFRPERWQMSAVWPQLVILFWSCLMAILWRYAGLRLVRRDWQQPFRR